MKVSESAKFKFILKLLGKEGYRAPIGQLNPSEKTRAPERESICRELADQGMVDYSYEIQKFGIESAGKALLQQDSELPLSEQHWRVLRACAQKTITPGDAKIPEPDRQPIIQDLAKKGFIKAEKVRIKEVWLTDEGRDRLRDEYSLNSTGLVSLGLVQNYLNFLRKAYRGTSVQTISAESMSAPESPSTPVEQDNQLTDKPTDQEVLQVIQQLDRELNTENYLPIFHLRQKLQPPFSRDELDQAIYRLQREDKIEMHSLIEAIHYTEAQIHAGISQDSSSPLFFISVSTSDSDLYA